MSLLQAFLAQSTIFVAWYGVTTLTFKDIDFSVRLFLQLNGPHGTENQILFFLFLALLYLLMRLQFATLYILEQHCNLFQAVYRSWLLTRHNNWLIERFFLWQVAAVTVLIFISPLKWNINLAIMHVAIILNYVINIQVRLFKELE